MKKFLENQLSTYEQMQINGGKRAIVEDELVFITSIIVEDDIVFANDYIIIEDDVVL